MKRTGLWTAGILVSTLAFTLASAAPAEAYIDPGSGSFLLQLVLGVLVGTAFAIRYYGSRLKEFILKLLPGEQHETE